MLIKGRTTPKPKYDKDRAECGKKIDRIFVKKEIKCPDCGSIAYRKDEYYECQKCGWYRFY